MFHFLFKVASYLRWQWSRAVRIPGFITNLLFGRVWNDIWLSRKRKVSLGVVPLTNCCAVYVIFPKNGLLASHLVSLNYLVQQGLSPCVVSNVPLNSSEREQILTLCWQLIERPNFGYDFGAYREGVLHIFRQKKSLTELFFLNDSAWFPMPKGRNWIDVSRQLNKDLVGAVSNGGMNKFMCAPQHGSRWVIDTAEEGYHYCSFALRIGANILGDPGFLRFWTAFKMSNDKRLTIIRGELGFSRWIIDLGYSHQATLDLSNFDSVLDQLDLSKLMELAGMLVIPENKSLRSEQASWLSRPENLVNREELIQFVLRSVADTGAAYALAHWALSSAGHDFLKKSPVWLNHHTSLLTERIIRQFGTEGMLSEAVSIRSTAAHQ